MTKSPLSGSGSGCIGSLLGGIFGVIVVGFFGANMLGGGPVQQTGFLPLDFVFGIVNLIVALIGLIIGVAVGGVLGSAIGSMIGVTAGNAVVTAYEQSESQPDPVETPEQELARLRLRMEALENAVSKSESIATTADEVAPTVAAPSSDERNASTDLGPPEPPPEPREVLWIGHCPECSTNVELTEHWKMGKSNVCPSCQTDVVMDFVRTVSRSV